MANPTFGVGKEGIDGAFPARRQVRPPSRLRSNCAPQLEHGRRGETSAQASSVCGTTAIFETALPRQRMSQVRPPSRVSAICPSDRAVGPKMTEPSTPWLELQKATDDGTTWRIVRA